MEREGTHVHASWAAGLVALIAILPVHAAAQGTVRVSLGAGAVQGNASSGLPKLSAGGRFVVFESDASNLVPGDTIVRTDVFLHDRVTGVTERISVDPGGAPPNGESYRPCVSADGRYVAFASNASNLVAGDTNLELDVFLRDRQSGTTIRASVGPGGVQANGSSLDPFLSADGRYLGFQSHATNLVAGDTNAQRDVFLRDLVAGTTERVSVGAGGAQTNDDSASGWVVPGGRFVAFVSEASNLAVVDTNANEDVFLRDRLTGTTECISCMPGGTTGDGSSLLAVVTPDGRHVAFRTRATNLVPGDTNAAADICVRDRLTATTTRVSVGPGGLQADSASGFPSISDDGRWLAFLSSASNLVPGDTNAVQDVFVHDRQAGATARVSVGPGGAQGDADSSIAWISADGRYVAFDSESTNLVVGDTNAVRDVFVRDQRPPFTLYCFGDGLDPAHTTPCPCGNIGAIGNGCANSVQPAGAHLGASGSTYTDTAVLAGSGMPATATCIYLQGTGTDDATFGDGVRCTGGTLFRLRTRANVAGASAFPDSTDTITLSARGGVAPFSGVVRRYQTYYRNAAAAFCPPETFNVTNGVVIDW
jgi:Tol biopolymer transport system component